ncbi:GH36-type glycosyl hydrolase domain-containing protein [Pseudomonas akapageensis]|uniref:GH36-type glycosyl hydrolase domain-containing protein n=1 Tax=Pseudomonas akapageensis TaxID=2609961 RepID=UPI00140771DF|nr:glucoamylase family protein [Pseudomonas akapageensis]
MQNILTRTLSSLRCPSAIWLRWSASQHKFEYEPILRSDLFNAQQMADHGIGLARQHQLGRLSKKDALLGRLADNQLLLDRSCTALRTAQLSSRRATPAAQWLLDNYYLIEENIRTARTHLPRGYSRKLPRLVDGPSAGLPRVYDIALETIAHGDGRVDAQSLDRFVAAYQTVTPLALGELWAIPIMLRLALIENLRRVASRVMANWDDRNLADDWADRLIEIAERDAKNVVLTVADMARSAPPMTPSFVAELARRLQGQSAALILPMAWIEQTLGESSLTVERLVQIDAQQQSGDQVSISNSIASLRLLAATDWRAFVELLSHVEQVLSTDPASVYGRMDFATRDLYRHAVERLARHCEQPETSVAQAAIELARGAQHEGSVAGHVGYYLVGDGRVGLEHRLRARVPLAARWKRLLQSAPLKFYLCPALLLTLLLAWPFLDTAYRNGTPAWILALLAVPALLMTSRLAIGLVNWLVTLTVAPSMLPRLDFSKGIPPEARTLVAIPTMFANAGDIEALAESLEVRFLANRDDNLHFALLSDFMDAPAEVMPDDAELLALARQLIEALNQKYADGQVDRFFLLHRPRHWSATERVWMGHERKRGKLAELNVLLRGKGQDRFALIVGDIEPLASVRFVITLDTDTLLPRDVARQCIGAMMHPLNHPVFDAQSRQIVSGYAILQPRVGISLPSTARSTYARLFGSDAGVDPYTRAASDVYQDLFHNGSFIGKGIYAVDAFEQALEGCLPDNRILSHDLIEGCYARSGLLSDVQLYEEYPARYSADAKRRHRWIRGDWQVLYWALPWAPKPGGGFARNPLSALARWKIFDNLRRSLEPCAFLVMLAWGWLGTAEPASWTLAVIILVFLQPVLHSVLALVQKAADIPMGQHLAAALRTSGQNFLRALLSIVWLPSDALMSVDAIGRTLWRMLVSKRLMLQWQPSREVERSSGNDLPGMYRDMWIAPGLALVVFAALLHSPLVLVLAAPLLLIWLASPAIAWWISLPTTPAGFNPTEQDLRFLRMLARKTWAFFDRYVGPADNWLPPDNFQEIPQETIAHRTSPTNMGMALLSHLAAHDFGYLSSGRLLERITRTLACMAGLERYQGHFYNWYDTQTRQPLMPRYVSTVDSGNLAGLLLTLRPGLLGLADVSPLDQRAISGLGDTLDVLQQALQDANLDDRAVVELRARVQLAMVGLQDNPDIVLQLLEAANALAIDLQATPDAEANYWLQALQAQCTDLSDDIQRYTLPPAMDNARQPAQTLRQLSQLDCSLWLPADHARVKTVRRLACDRIASLADLTELAASLASMDFTFLYDHQRDLFSIGYNADERRLDSGYYDLLASEVRLTNFVVIAQGQLPQQAWFTLGRLLSNNREVPVLLSWSGSMFEYLMPMLVMPSFEGTLLDQTCRAAVALQREHGHRLGIPWGVSESGYNTLDAHFNYQYRAFGVPGLGLKRGLGEDTVVAPYASALALMVEPEAACHNLQRLAAQGSAGRFGLYEAVDYTEARLPRGQRYAVVRSFMAHHQGMSLLALTSLLLDRPMQRRFESIPAFQATALLLQERVPKTAAPYLHAAHSPADQEATQAQETRLRVFADPGSKRPAVQLLSNGHYHVMVSSAGGGYSRCNDIAVTRWHEDATCDNWGMFCYLRDVASGVFWSTAHQPTLHQPESHEAIFSDARAEFRVREHDFDTHTEIVVSPEDDIELRRLHITNRGRVRRSIEITTYAEVVLAPAISDAIHPAFSNLFVQTELLPQLQAIICTRRPRASDEAVPWMCHQLAAHGVDIDAISYETDRARFIGRGRSVAAPAALDGDVQQLSGTAGPVLDPIVAIRCRIALEPGQTATIDLVTGVAESREGCLQLINKYRDRHLADRVFDLAWTHGQVLLRQLNASLEDARLFEQMASSILYANASLRAENSVLMANRRDQSSLWGQAISGDLPIVLLQVSTLENIELVQQMVKAHAYWRQKGLIVDLVIWNEDQAGYRQQLQDLIMGVVTSGSEAALVDRPGGIFMRPAQQLSFDDRTLILSVARLVLSEGNGSLAEQIHRRHATPVFPPLLPTLKRQPQRVIEAVAPASEALILGNAYGGFSADGREYVMTLKPGRPTPAPWANVLANPHFGTVVSESGGAYTWMENAHEYRLSPWHNDPVTDASGEAIYVRDEETGHFWSVTPQPCPGNGTYRTRHGFGYSVFEHDEDGIQSQLWVYVAQDAPIKFSHVQIRNRSGRARRLSVTCYVEWVLGDLRSKSAMHVVTEAEAVSGALFARNAYSIEFSERVAFLDTDSTSRSISGDRCEFIGRGGSLKAPAGMKQARLSGRTGGGFDPCAAIQVALDLDNGEDQDVVFRLGAAADTPSALRLVQQYRGPRAAAGELAAVREHWRSVLGAVQVETPDPSIDVMVNGWLMYQVIACRFQARSGYYQSGGAFGFRDQLQDSMAMIHADPAAVRRHLLLCAAHQYPEGDVQHWWHPPLDRGVRSGCSDDFLWLALATSRYVSVTADLSVLVETVGYLEGRALNAGEESYYDLPGKSSLEESLYQHCVRAIEHSLARGSHGLPLMGSGDWNDGMNRVGHLGLGESVWLGFFGFDVLQQFAVTAQVHGDAAFAKRCSEEAARLQASLEEHAWDGSWYRRAWFDDGQLLGSASNDECRIDSISQSWSVLSGAASPARRRTAMASVEKHLVRPGIGAVLLLDPPFDKGSLDPGYIKGYVPGVRENGGQYTHAAVWAGMAFARLGDSTRAWSLLNMINPAGQGTDAQTEIYKVEPYVMAADVYGTPPHAGRGGWTWYTGSAGWMYRLIVESLLGLQRIGTGLRIVPLLPAHWPGYTLHYRYGATHYTIEVLPAVDARPSITLDGKWMNGDALELLDDGVDHRVLAHCTANTHQSAAPGLTVETDLER